MSNQHSSAFLGGLLVGSAVGAVMGLLFAPRSGRDTRYLVHKTTEALPDLAEDLSTNLQLQADRLSESAIRRWDDTLERLAEAIAAGIDAAKDQQQHLQQAQSDQQQSVS